jgi:hypothetical protein
LAAGVDGDRRCELDEVDDDGVTAAIGKPATATTCFDRNTRPPPPQRLSA